MSAQQSKQALGAAIDSFHRQEGTCSPKLEVGGGFAAADDDTFSDNKIVDGVDSKAAKITSSTASESEDEHLSVYSDRQSNPDNEIWHYPKDTVVSLSAVEKQETTQQTMNHQMPCTGNLNSIQSGSGGEITMVNIFFAVQDQLALPSDGRLSQASHSVQSAQLCLAT